MKVFIIAAVSADGKIAEKKNQVSLDWTSKEDLKFFVKKTKEAGAVVMGRTTYDTIGKPLKDRLNVVMTRDTAGKESIPDQLLYTSDSPEEIIKMLEGRGFEQIAISGGDQIYSLFLKAGLVTDMYLTIEPVLFGRGTPLAEEFDRIDLELIETEQLNDSTVMLHYRVK